MKLDDAIKILKAYAKLHNFKTLGEILKCYNQML